MQSSECGQDIRDTPDYTRGRISGLSNYTPIVARIRGHFKSELARLDCYTSIRAKPWTRRGKMFGQSFTFIDPGGNQAQYTVYEVDRHNEYHWSTDHGDSGYDGSYAQAQIRARTALKASMTARRKLSRQY